MLNDLIDSNKGPFNDNTIKQLFKEIFKASTDLQKSENEKHLYVSRKLKPEDTIVTFDNGALLETAINHLYLGHVQLNHLNKLKLLLKTYMLKVKNLFVAVHLSHVHHHMTSKV